MDKGISSHLQNTERITLQAAHTEVPRSRETAMYSSQDASKYGWAGVLTHTHDTDNNDILTLSHTIKADESDMSSTNKADGTPQMIFHPVTYVSGLFRESQLNWAALTQISLCHHTSLNQETQLLPHKF